MLSRFFFNTIAWQGGLLSSVTCSVFPSRFSKYILIASAHFINVRDDIFVIGINLKTVMASTTQTLIFVGKLFIGFSGDINCNLLQKSD